MSPRARYDAVVVGAGPNGLAAAITLARAGRSVVVYEARDTVGGGCRTQTLTLPGFRHDVCSAIHPLALASPFFRALPLADFGLEWMQPDIPLAHPLPGGRAALLDRAFTALGATLGKDDARAWRRLFEPLVAHEPLLIEQILAPLRPRFQATHPAASRAFARFALLGVRSAHSLAEHRFHGEAARALFGGMAAHAIRPLDRSLTAAVGLLLGLTAHAVGWPIPRGGSQAIADALAGYLLQLGGEIETDTAIEALDQHPPARAVLCDV
ncbi:MAG: phytoene desaturase family protein, partial [Ktedonobacterales bacterium]